MEWQVPGRTQLNALRVTTIARLLRLRRGRFFTPAILTVAAVGLSGGGVGYAAWDSTRVDIPGVVGAPYSESIEALGTLGLSVKAAKVSDDTIDANCYVVSTQDVAAGTRVVPADTVVTLKALADERKVPDVVRLSVAEARESLVDACFHERVLETWCVPESFSGGDAALDVDQLSNETGFTYDAKTGRLYNPDLTAKDDWVVCSQTFAPSSTYASSTSIPIAVTVPLTTVPKPSGLEVGQTLTAFDHTADDCELAHSIFATFTPDPDAVRSETLPPLEEMNSWQVVSLTPAIGHAALCDSAVRIEVEWPSVPMPQLIGLRHVPETPTTPTPATAALENGALDAACSGRGTVTVQVPAAGTLVPRGTAVKCVAELVVPNIVGLDPTTANALLIASGLSGYGTGSGVVVTQNPAAGTVATSTQGVSYAAEQPRVSSGSAYYQNCTAVRAAGAAPLYRGEAGYRAGLDRDGDGVACEV